MKIPLGVGAGLAGLALAAGSPAYACGYCIEDRVAAVYDHGVISRALEKRHPVAFFALDGSASGASGARRIILAALASTRGIDAASPRVSTELAALSFSFDAARISASQVEQALNRKLAASGQRVALLKLIE